MIFTKTLKIYYKPKCKTKTIKLPQNTWGEKLVDIGHDHDFTDTRSKSCMVRERQTRSARLH